ncbi:MAG: thiol:disulfide interchange protein DsbA/DsbL [Kistimonas sp.]|nr:thiol:disulfide interchange protein DsbA/DsbL [Kistimonas sp.]
MLLNLARYKRLLLSLAVFFPLLATASPWKEGTHFVRLEKELTTQASTGIEVVGVFSYGCPACYSLEASLMAWRKRLPQSVSFRKLPVGFNRSRWEEYGRLYFTLEALNLPASAHEDVFRAVQVQRMALRSVSDMAKLFAPYDVTAEKFTKTFKSFGVKRKMHAANVWLGDAAVDSIPLLIINGKYKVSPQLAGSTQALFQIADYLIAQERKNLDSGSATSVSG